MLFKLGQLMARGKGSAVAGFDPSTLFASSEDGALFDPSDLTSLYQGRTGGSNSGIGDVVGLMLDKRLMGDQTAAEFIAAQSEHISSFTQNLSGWTSLSATEITSDGSDASRATSDASVIAGDYYLLEYEVTGGVSGLCQLRLGGTFVRTEGSSDVIRSDIVKAFDTTPFSVTISGSWIGTMTNISIKHIPGNHALAPSDAARPILRQSGNVFSIEDDNVDDALNVTLPDLGSDATEIIMTTTGVTINTAQTIGAGSRDALTDNMVGYAVIDRALTAQETSDITAYAATKRGA